MTLFELLFVLVILSLSTLAGVYGSLLWGMWIGIACALAAAFVSVGLVQFVSCLGERFHKSPMKCPCGSCNDRDYAWVGSDNDSNPIAKYKCGRMVVLKNGVCQAMKKIRLSEGMEGET